jgi:hypothetical protein
MEKDNSSLGNKTTSSPLSSKDWEDSEWFKQWLYLAYEKDKNNRISGQTEPLSLESGSKE